MTHDARDDAFLPPLRLGQRPVAKIWGGRRLKSMFGLALPPGQDIGESWLLYDRPEGSSECIGRAASLRELMQTRSRDLLGEGVAPGFGGRFPLMLKLIDAREQLSLQVHPDGDAARSDGDGGKHEAMVVLRTGADAQMVHGLRPGVTKQQLLDAVADADVDPLLQRFRPRVGDCIDIPPGTVHAVGPDVVLFEVQQNSDLTYRLHDWGRGRAVDAAKALRTARVDGGCSPAPAARPMPGGGFVLTENPWFRVRRYQSISDWTMHTLGRFLTLTVVSGRGSLEWREPGGPQTFPLMPGDTVLVPASLSEVRLSVATSLDVLACDPAPRLMSAVG